MDCVEILRWYLGRSGFGTMVDFGLEAFRAQGYVRAFGFHSLRSAWVARFHQISDGMVL